ncbi:hypothetical protein [Persicobacter psychrovividus]|uniref:Tetratricopeptide repeat protein n=1 Tax=Persicobacter psychrovividus TaxID=387638 RepID=A0ABN6L9Y6_9BACT|nr:hypothetical protein PEPS_04190 [Persicobacter psychrovividus]
MRRFLFLMMAIVLPLYSYAMPTTQIRNDKKAMRFIEEGLTATYNFEFKKAEAYADSLETYLQQDPTIYLLKARILFWQQKFEHKNEKMEQAYTANLDKGIALTAERLKAAPDDAELKFVALTFNAMYAEYWFDEGSSMKAISYGKVLYSYVKEGFNLIDQFPDFYFTTGLYNYYRIKFPQNNPVYRPFMFFFKSGDLELGLHQMEIATEKGIFTDVESRQYLYHLLMHYGAKPQQAFKHSEYLHKHYPNNPYFTCMYLENLAYLQRVNSEEVALALDLSKRSNPMFSAPGNLLMGRFLALDQPTDPQVKEYLLKAEKAFQQQEHPSDHGLCVTYINLAKYCDATNDQTGKATYKKLAQKHNKYDVDKQQIGAL